MINKEYNKKRPLITIRADLNRDILRFIHGLKRKNLGSKWINEAIKEKYDRLKR